MIMQCTERGESNRSPEENVSAGNGVISHIQSGITVDEVNRGVSASLPLSLSLAKEGGFQIPGEKDEWRGGGKKRSRLDCSARENEMAPQHASCRPETRALGARWRKQDRETNWRQITAETEVEEDKAKQSKARESECNGREDVPMAVYAIQRRRKALCLVP